MCDCALENEKKKEPKKKTKYRDAVTRLNANSPTLLFFVPIAFKELRHVNYQACVRVVQRRRRRRVDAEHNYMMEDGDAFP